MRAMGDAGRSIGSGWPPTQDQPGAGWATAAQAGQKNMIRSSLAAASAQAVRQTRGRVQTLQMVVEKVA